MNLILIFAALIVLVNAKLFDPNLKNQTTKPQNKFRFLDGEVKPQNKFRFLDGEVKRYCYEKCLDENKDDDDFCIKHCSKKNEDNEKITTPKTYTSPGHVSPPKNPRKNIKNKN